MKKIGAILLILTMVFSLAACANTQQSATYTADHSSGEPEQGGDLSRPKIVIAYDAENGASAVAETANLLQKTLGGDLYEIESETSDDFSSYEFVLLGFESNQNSLPQRIRDYLRIMTLEPEQSILLLLVKKTIQMKSFPLSHSFSPAR